MFSRWWENFEQFALAVMEGRRRGVGATVLKAVLWVFSLAYSAIIQSRVWLYSKNILRPHTLGCQVISVGNLTVGGTGKTPVVEVFARALSRNGRRVAILSRGYKKREVPLLRRLRDVLLFRKQPSPTRVVSAGGDVLLDSAMGGDEPYMLAVNLPGVSVLVDKNRARAGQYAIQKLGCDTLILDDGFQHLALRHRLDIVLVDRTNPFGNRRVLPRGVLREPYRNIDRAGFIFLTKSTGDGAEELKRELRALNPGAEIAECRHAPKRLQEVYTRERQELAALRGRRVAALSGIAAPKGFEDSLKILGAEVVYAEQYADHHRYRRREIIKFLEQARAHGAEWAVTTEKDAVRFPKLDERAMPVYFLRVEIELLSGAEDFDACIRRICFK